MILPEFDPLPQMLPQVWMDHALQAAAQGRGFVEPNPMVGAVIADADGGFVSDGWHQRFGGPHAEIHALEEAGERARGSTLIVTLEPCSHHGKTPPCVDAVIRAGVKRVFVAMEDPFPEVAGRGIAKLRDAGVEVHVGLREAEAKRLNAPYLKLLRTGMPWVHAKWAMSLDGKIATRTGDSKWISCEESRRRVHELRGKMDAIIVGRSTVEKDDPLLTARPPGARIATRVVLASHLPETCQLRSTAREIPVLIATAKANEARFAGWVADGAEVFACDTIRELLVELGRRRFTNVLVEGGSGVLGSVIDARAADEFHVFIAPKIVGCDAALSPVGGTGAAMIAESLRLGSFTTNQIGDDIYLHGFASP
ncbi:MAG: bifunctional diaminohydroxyphosphoribosylaminopyrimidine deaminase/5-amino-6-(5-phosphoribosylamino)uracil reductase RibD [Gemmataceae bacterium]